MYWVRVDNRLVHGQVIETWLPYTDAHMLVVCNDEVAGDVLQQEIMALAIPHSVRTLFSTVAELSRKLLEMDRAYDRADVLVLFASCQDARRAVEGGVVLKVLNIGNLHYAPGKRQLLPHVAVSEGEAACLSWFKERGVELDFRCLPTEPVSLHGGW